MFSFDSICNHCPGGQHVIRWQYPVLRVESLSPASGCPESAAILVDEPTARQVIGGLVLLVEATPLQQFTFLLHYRSSYKGLQGLIGYHMITRAVHERVSDCCGWVTESSRLGDRGTCVESCKTGHGVWGSVAPLPDIHHLGLVVEAQPRYIVCQPFVNRPSVKKEEGTDG